MFATTIESVWRNLPPLRVKVQGYRSRTIETYGLRGPRQKSDVHVGIRVSDCHKRKGQNRTRFMSSHTAVFLPIDHPYMSIFRLMSVTMGTTGSVMAWASPPDLRRSTILRSTIKSLLIVERTQSPVVLLPCQPHLLFGMPHGQCIYYERYS